MSNFNRDEMWNELEERGYCVVPNVLSIEQCDQYITELKDWAANQNGLDFTHKFSLMNLPRVGHLETIWKIRLHAKQVFAALWGTDKLVSSFDKFSMAPPPEEGTGDFDSGYIWLHVDRDGRRRGLHAVQGGVYLEETSLTDQCLRVMEGSVKFTDEFFSTHPQACEKSKGKDHYRLSNSEIEWYKSKGCVNKKIPAPKGSMILWDSRTVHDNVKATFGRPNSDRWRFVIFACMMPAQWLSEEDLQIKKYAYENMLLTCHMPCLNVRIHKKDSSLPEDLYAIEELPEIAKSKVVRQLVGIEKYDFNDGKPNGPKELPKWIPE
ncbi:hypothetical protein LOTGIDRAFT_171297 [Lottia gigantea]|uniref:Phytanoyl-CoA dioxygenase n=1 Tax=Lottia gigantea TaxID=225164 RepID=V4BBS0_LOTGI|nr:hypothetical protein LOTGIDRAFT_171297 [Lottia gigantea]ESP03512.1 hypothetical protein LOTGIDRAFT_171297 [Lottia gigantea]